MDLRKTIGWNLRRLRVARGLSQERLALESEIDRSYVGRVERGKENVTVATLEAFAKVLSINVSELFAEVDHEDNRPPSLRSGRKRRAS
ncbi:helix-turn-helix domain-containing protein [Rhizobium lusitanum]|uniref:Helix-turn-helix domain-containing protein n=1 Tax=Rhizobium lusitanum TaxID=293958 RepID=A0A6L9UJY4_9HYPH|nr:helix-turn-helix transcriptional regulator [Rhizobium lusitanum]NEI74878.1 helix-turn-helix domain-containing protein [Rhizobium lusitanum]